MTTVQQTEFAADRNTLYMSRGLGDDATCIGDPARHDLSRLYGSEQDSDVLLRRMKKMLAGIYGSDLHDFAASDIMDLDC